MFGNIRSGFMVCDFMSKNDLLTDFCCSTSHISVTCSRGILMNSDTEEIASLCPSIFTYLGMDS